MYTNGIIITQHLISATHTCSTLPVDAERRQLIVVHKTNTQQQHVIMCK